MEVFFAVLNFCAIPDSNSLFRGVHHSIAFVKGGKIFDKSRCFALRPNKSDPRKLETSLVWERYAPTIECVHAYGCRLSSTRNLDRAPNKKDTYCGAYHIKAYRIRDLARIPQVPEIVEADVIHLIETDELAHANLEIRLQDGLEADVIDIVKTAIVAHLWASSRGPLPHTCPADAGDASHPSERLENPPSGKYFDDRSYAARHWFALRAWVLGRLWRWLAPHAQPRTAGRQLIP
jgi:hypothetical protein